MNKTIFTYFFLFGLSINAYAQSPVIDVTAQKDTIYSSIPSASGITKFQESHYLIGDDSPYLFQLNEDYEVIKTIKIYSDKKLENNRLPKKVKPDFECITQVPWGNDEDLLVFGSGSSKKRNTLIRIDIDEEKIKVTDYSLKKFYKHLKNESDSEEINIEGVAYLDDQLFLLNRADNSLFIIDFKDFKKYIKGKEKDEPKIKTVKFNLPSINGVQARFSGLTVIPGEEILVFSASLENKPNWMTKDNIIGSFVGIIDINQLENTTPICELVKKNNSPIKEKIESLTIIQKSDEHLQLIGVADNDNGSSTLLEIQLRKL